MGIYNFSVHGIFFKGYLFSVLRIRPADPFLVADDFLNFAHQLPVDGVFNILDILPDIFRIGGIGWSLSAGCLRNIAWPAFLSDNLSKRNVVLLSGRLLPMPPAPDASRERPVVTVIPSKGGRR